MSMIVISKNSSKMTLRISSPKKLSVSQAKFSGEVIDAEYSEVHGISFATIMIMAVSVYLVAVNIGM